MSRSPAAKKTVIPKSRSARDKEENPLVKEADYAGIVAALLKAGAKMPDNRENLRRDLPCEVPAVLRRAGS